MSPVKPCIWFEDHAEEAMNFYTATFPNSRIIHIERYTGSQGIPGEDKMVGKVLTGIFEINGQEFHCLDGGPQFELTSAISFVVEFDSQPELDQIWARLLVGGKPQQCGWITDRFGVTWQVVPKVFAQMMQDKRTTNRQKAALMKAMMPMVKLDGDRLEQVYEQAKE